MNKEEIKEIKDEFEDCYGYPIGDEYIFSICKPILITEVYFLITPKSYWDNEKCQYDQAVSVADGGLLQVPKGFYEEEGQFSYNGNLKDGIKKLIDSNIKFSLDFQKFIEDCSVDNFEIDDVSVNQYMLTNYAKSII